MAKRKKSSHKRKSTVKLPTRKEMDSIVDDPLLSYLKKQGLKYIDLRDRLGCLWIIGGLDISKKIKPLQKSGLSISFKPGGSTATKGKDAWWTTDKPANLSLAVEDPLLSYLKKQGLKYIDRRDRLGCLWIIGGLDISKKIKPLQKSGVSVSFKPGGSTTTKGKDAWWTTDKPANLSLTEKKQPPRFRKQPSPANSSTKPRPMAQDIPYQEEVPSNGRKAFSRWLATQYGSSSTVKNASWAVSKASEYAAKYQLIQCSIFDIGDPNLLAQIWEQLNDISEFVAFRRKNGVASSAFNKYIQFRGGKGVAHAMKAMKNEKTQDMVTSQQQNEQAESKSDKNPTTDSRANQPENKLFEGHIEYKEGTTGITFDNLLIPYLCGAKSIQIVDPYLQNYWQIRNLDELLQGLVKVKSPETDIDVTVITKYNEKYNEDPDLSNKQKEYLDQICDGFMSAGIHLAYCFDNTIHDRYITTDTGWIIILGRGLDIFQTYDGKKAFCIKKSLQSFRACKRFTIAYIRNGRETDHAQ